MVLQKLLCAEAIQKGAHVHSTQVVSHYGWAGIRGEYGLRAASPFCSPVPGRLSGLEHKQHALLAPERRDTAGNHLADVHSGYPGPLPLSFHLISACGGTLLRWSSVPGGDTFYELPVRLPPSCGQ